MPNTEDELVEAVYLREVDGGTDNACWVVCNKMDPGAVAFVQERALLEEMREWTVEVCYAHDARWMIDRFAKDNGIDLSGEG